MAAITLKNPGLYLRRRIANVVFIALAMGAALFGLVWLALILKSLLVEGFGAIRLTTFTLPTPPPTMEGGLYNSILGSLMMSGLAVLIGTPIGLLCGTYLAEYGRHGKFGFYVRFINDILLSAPSIIIGLFIYGVMVMNVESSPIQKTCETLLGNYCPMGHFSGVAGVLALAVIVIPVVARTTENMLLLVPNGLREAACALGAPMNFVIRAVTWKAARAGIVTGVLLAVARISGETAPLLFTAVGNNFTSHDLSHPLDSLPTRIFNFAMSSYEDEHRLAWAGALIITATVLSLSIIARMLEKKQRN